MRDVKVMMQIVGNSFEEGIARMSAGHDQVRRQRDLSGAHGPDMQIMHAFDPGQGAQQRIDLGEGDAFRHAVEQQV